MGVDDELVDVGGRVDNSLYLHLVPLLSDLPRTLIDQDELVLVVEDEDAFELEQGAPLGSSLDLPLVDDVVVLHLDDCVEGAEVGVFVVGDGGGEGVGEGGGGDLDGEGVRVDFEGGGGGGGEGGGGGLGEGEFASEESADGPVGVKKTFYVLLIAHVEATILL